MAIITFWSDSKKETAKTLSMAAIATYMAIEHNYKILEISTIHNDSTLQNCYWEEKSGDLVKQITGREQDIASGIDGIASLSTSNKLTPAAVSNYTRLVFPNNRLEVLSGSIEADEDEYKRIRETYKDVIKTANNFYDYVFVDLNKGLSKDYIREILKISDIVVVNIKQGIREINHFKDLEENQEILKKDNTLVLIGMYDKDSKYNSKNVARALNIRDDVLTIPYNTLFLEGCNDGKIVDTMMRFRKINPTDKNAIFLEEVKRATSSIIERIKLLRSIY